MAEEIEFEEVEEEWDEVLIDMRRFAVEQAVLLRAPGDTLADVLKAAERIVQYIAHGPE
ncbi:MAG: hypothetical protein KJZ75_05350 [Hyphomonadaceae bacterium]|nr:hypothetical protein [Hyphomonadaceae bacterium]